jgi:hypothetical protein
MNYLTFIENIPGNSRKAKYLCICGTEKILFKSNVNQGYTKSCGCYNRKVVIERLTTHGLTNHPLNGVWYKMHDRCYNPNVKSFKDYGARGIFICEEWRDNFLAFYNWAIKNGWRKGLTIERIDNDKEYSPQNCKIDTRKAQANNRRSNTMLLFHGVEKTISQWANEVNIRASVISCRLFDGWSVEDALSTRPRKSPIRKTKQLLSQHPISYAFGFIN